MPALDVRAAVFRGPHQPLSIGQNTRVVDLSLRRSTCSLAASQGVIQVAENAALDPLS